MRTLLKSLVAAINELRAAGQLLAYHDRSDGGLWAAVCEMAFAGQVGVSLNVDLLVTEGDGIGDSRAEVGDSKNWATQIGARRNELSLKALFNEELGAVIQVPRAQRDAVMATLRRHGLGRLSHAIGRLNADRRVEVWRDAKAVLGASLRDLQQAWDEVSWRIARLRDHPDCADAEHAAAGAEGDAGLHLHLSFDPSEAPALLKSRPKVAILREQGVNSHVEMSYAMAQAGFDSFDVHMSDLQSGRARLDMFQALVACGGFSYGDTLGAGEGWARSILFNPALAEQFAAFFNRADTLALGVCNGCQMMAALCADHPRRRGVAEVHAQPKRAVRSAPVDGGGAATARACSSPAWPAAGCQSPWRMAKALRISRSVGTPGRCNARCASSTVADSRPKPIPPIQTAAPRA